MFETHLTFPNLLIIHLYKVKHEWSPSELPVDVYENLKI